MRPVEESLQFEAERAVKRVADAEVGAGRLREYRARIDMNYQCPLCWMRDEVRSPLDPIPTGTRDDAFGCDRCGSDYLIER